MQSILENHPRILVRQAKEWGEILTGFETRNRFHLFDEGGNDVAGSDVGRRRTRLDGDPRHPARRSRPPDLPDRP